MRSLHSLALLSASVITSGLLVMLSHAWIVPLRRPLFGIYEPLASGVQNSQLDLDVLFLNWNDRHATSRLHRFLAQAQRRGRLPLLTVEPFVDSAPGDSVADLSAHVLAGHYDRIIANLTSVLSEHQGPILLRFGHEMDKTGQYPWALDDSERFIAIYRYFHYKVQSKARHVVWVWSPAGVSSADRFWPGHQYVDVIGLSIYASRSWTSDGSLESFGSQLRNKIRLQRLFRKPVLLAEVGVSGSAADQQRWIHDAVHTLASYPEVCGLVYFQAQQPSWMPLATGHENWQLKEPALQWLLTHRRLEPRHGLSCVED